MRLARLGLVPLIVVPMAWVLFQGLGRDPGAIPSALIDRPTPPVVAARMNGATVSLAAFRGRP